jgi:hypothetical protein
MLALYAAASLIVSSLACQAPDGTAALLEMPQRAIIIGEMHGTAQAPAALGRMACAAADRGPVTVALELPTSMQAQLDAFLAAPDETTAVAALSGTAFMDGKITDGRGSEAMLALMQSVRALRVQGRDVVLHAFQPDGPWPAGLGGAWYELEMAHALTRAIHARPEAKVLVLAGNLHARKRPSDRFPGFGLPAIGHLPTADTLSLQVAYQGGTAWNCQPECGVHPMGAAPDTEPRGVILEPQRDGEYDGLLALGPATASPPVGTER